MFVSEKESHDNLKQNIGKENDLLNAALKEAHKMIVSERESHDKLKQHIGDIQVSVKEEIEKSDAEVRKYQDMFNELKKQNDAIFETFENGKKNQLRGCNISDGKAAQGTAKFDRTASEREQGII